LDGQYLKEIPTRRALRFCAAPRRSRLCNQQSEQAVAKQRKGKRELEAAIMGRKKSEEM
jgi:hypothetical protein